jgi:hypothetical protein
LDRFLGVGGNKAKTMARLQEIVQGLFGKKQVLPKVMESVEVLAYIVAQIAAHKLVPYPLSLFPQLNIYLFLPA